MLVVVCALLFGTGYVIGFIHRKLSQLAIHQGPWPLVQCVVHPQGLPIAHMEGHPVFETVKTLWSAQGATVLELELPYWNKVTSLRNKADLPESLQDDPDWVCVTLGAAHYAARQPQARQVLETKARSHLRALQYRALLKRNPELGAD